jgi:hypothetical protein
LTSAHFLAALCALTSKTLASFFAALAIVSTALASDVKFGLNEIPVDPADWNNVDNDADWSIKPPCIVRLNNSRVSRLEFRTPIPTCFEISFEIEAKSIHKGNGKGLQIVDATGKCWLISIDDDVPCGIFDTRAGKYIASSSSLKLRTGHAYHVLVRAASGTLSAEVDSVKLASSWSASPPFKISFFGQRSGLAVKSIKLNELKSVAAPVSDSTPGVLPSNPPKETGGYFGSPVDPSARTGSSAPNTAKNDPVIGHWRWGNGNFFVDILAGGSTRSWDNSGVWKVVPSQTAERKYEISWKGGARIDMAILSQDGGKLTVENNKWGEWTAEKVPPLSTVHSEESKKEESAPPAVTAKAPETRIDELIERKSVIADDLFGALDKEVPASIRDYLADLRENLLDEAARKPVASKDAYNLGARFCNGLIAVYDEREMMAARLRNNAPGQAAGAPTTTKVHPNWIDYLRERDEAAAASHNNTIETPFAKMNIMQWRTRAGELRRTLDAFYAQFRAAARQPVTPK